MFRQLGWWWWMLRYFLLFTGQKQKSYGKPCQCVFNVHSGTKSQWSLTVLSYLLKAQQIYLPGPTFSSYKHHNTIKILIRITPQGSILCIWNLGEAHLTSSLQRTVNFYNICQLAIWSWQNWLFWLHQKKIQEGPHLSKESNTHGKCLHPRRKSDYTALAEVF